MVEIYSAGRDQRLGRFLQDRRHAKRMKSLSENSEALAKIRSASKRVFRNRTDQEGRIVIIGPEQTKKFPDNLLEEKPDERHWLIGPR